jgi:hypothetical protein
MKKQEYYDLIVTILKQLNISTGVREDLFYLEVIASILCVTIFI